MEEKLVLVSGYGVPGEDDIALYGIAGERAVKRFGLYHGRAPSFCCKGDDGVVYAPPAASASSSSPPFISLRIWLRRSSSEETLSGSTRTIRSRV